MPKKLDAQKDPVCDDRLQVPTKAEFLEVLHSDSSRAGLPLEWMLDRCADRERTV
ncbi:hypothetical protein QTO30_13610 [Yoonia sp. GPGPB17]|uniref:hypothetical protein n=1 Tax=Yoonia sp. GPGPB17 TaxID=3026147 RepID=UPI0030C4FF8D